MNRSKVSGCIAVVFPLVLVQCGGDDQQVKSPPQAEYRPITPVATTPRDTTPMTPASDTAQPAPAKPAAPEPAAPPAPPPLTDAEITGLTDTVNSAEISRGQLALKKSKNQRVKNYAQLMITHHSKAQKEQKALVKKLGVAPKDSDKTIALRARAAESNMALKELSGAEFDKKYIDDQVEVHRKVLDAFDKDLIPNAQDPELKKQLSEFRPKVEAHLTEALEIQAHLNKASTQTTAPGTPSTPSGSSKQ